MRSLGAALVVALALAAGGCGGSSVHSSTQPVHWLKGHATIIPLHSAFIAVKGLDPEQQHIVRFILGAKKVGAGSYYLPPKQYAANCAAGSLPSSICP